MIFGEISFGEIGAAENVKDVQAKLACFYSPVVAGMVVGTAVCRVVGAEMINSTGYPIACFNSVKLISVNFS